MSWNLVAWPQDRMENIVQLCPREGKERHCEQLASAMDPLASISPQMYVTWGLYDIPLPTSIHMNKTNRNGS
jgi:hypothetical protein